MLGLAPWARGAELFMIICYIYVFICMYAYLKIPGRNPLCVGFKWYISNKLYDTYKKNCTKSTNKISVISVSLIFHGVGQMSKFECMSTLDFGRELWNGPYVKWITYCINCPVCSLLAHPKSHNHNLLDGWQVTLVSLRSGLVYFN